MIFNFIEFKIILQIIDLKIFGFLVFDLQLQVLRLGIHKSKIRLTSTCSLNFEIFHQLVLVLRTYKDMEILLKKRQFPDRNSRHRFVLLN